MKKKEKIKLSPKQKKQMEQMLVKGRWSPRELKRAEILLMADQQKKLNKREISRQLKCGRDKVIRVLQRFQKHYDLDEALFDLARPGQPKRLTPKEEAFVIATACSDAPEGNPVWTLELLQKNLQEHKGKSVSKSKIGSVLLKHELKPWKKKMWCVPKLTEKFIRKMDDVLDVYALDYDRQKPVICIDEKSTQLLSTPRGNINPKPGKTKKVDYEYKRHGTANIFVAIEPKTGRRNLKVTKRRTANDFAEFVHELVMKKYRKVEKVILVMDNLNTHREKSLIVRYGEKKAVLINARIEWHYSPEHASWLNMAGMEIGKMTRKVLGKRIQTEQELKQEIAIYEKIQNQNKPVIHWKFTKEKAHQKFKLPQN